MITKQWMSFFLYIKQRGGIMQCVRGQYCFGKKSKPDLTLDDYRSIVSPSETLLKLYEEEKEDEGHKHDMFNMTDQDHICWDCVWTEIEGTACDGIDHAVEIKIRAECKKYMRDYLEGQDLYTILNSALEYSCFSCGGGNFRVYLYDLLSERQKGNARKLLKDYHATLQETGRKINVCPRCESDLVK